MARLASQAKLGYYPTPNEIVGILKSMLDFEPDTRILDPCCGDGEALANIAAGRAETWGIELEKNRFLAAQQRLDNVLHADALREITYQGPAAFDCLFLNPPYGFELLRLEMLFIRKYIRYLCPKGLLIGIFPESAFRVYDFRKTLAVLKGLEIRAFPPSLFWEFRQYVVFVIFRPILVQ
ncbi:Methyltransferase domain-containing protein [Desulfacinum hydrothermale DSM 13146]|uniref:Methyltransferase domain-containing protein n=1 Tax=Desulfacinum hydrothermale DSM 13146 TaxID=1121390 RepID=A0A1W1XWW0_9BACT|nr:DUF6094 domain-containing protein [Desulfacinum hydrothermale]SMC28416.1 Methyltransferase domain-containing protein [Desulfacinum hydrothermale DSM 13146]